MQKVTFNNKNSVFFETLKQKVEEYFKVNNIRETGNIRLYSKTAFLLLSAIIIYLILVFYTPAIWISVLLCILMGVNLSAIGFNTMHDGAHGSFSRKTWVNELMAFSLNAMGGNAYIWKAKHNLFHHSYTNIEGMDDDIDIKPWIRVNENQKKYWYHRFQHIYWAVLYGTTYFLWIYIQDFQKYFTGRVGENEFKKMDIWNHIVFWLSKIIYTLTFIVLPIYIVGWVKALVGYLIISFVTGFVISVVFQLAHVVENAEFHMPTDTDQSFKIDNEWAIHQVLTTADFATKSKIVSWFTGGLNFQVEHHLFPRISHIHYPKIRNLVKDTCKQFDIAYLEFPTLFSAIRSHVLHLKQVGNAV